ncbi:MAG: class I mannose-6-phosphate isomerase [Oscillospiraceae bacterium]|nr:class I mannose-6-phosphate isomerase [Oscillospiraceae bacterium]
MPAFKLLPACKDYIWGGQRLKTDFGIQSELDPLSEAWVLSCHPDGPSVLANGPYAGLTLPQYIERAGNHVLGTNCHQFHDFPMLVKLIDAKQNLSVQVHPGDEYALAHEGQYGKTEMWVVLDAVPGAYLYYGFQREVTREEVTEYIEKGALTDILRKLPVKKGDVIFIPAGTLHAIGAGLVIAEIQQNSNVTYRVFDYGRVGADGKPRELHVSKALEVACLRPAAPVDFGSHLGSCRYFTTDLHTGDYSGQCGEDSFLAVLVIHGSGELTCGGLRHEVKKGECWFLPAGSGAYSVNGQCEYLVIYLS